MKKFVFTFLISLFLIFNGEVFAQLPAPTLISPPNHGTNIPLFPDFQWTVVTGATSYQLQIYQGVTTILNQTNILTNHFLITTAILQPNTTYSWRVKAYTPNGSWSMVWDFTTAVAAPPAPVLSYPPNDTTNIPLITSINWNAVLGAASYSLQVSRYVGFDSLAINISGLTNPGYVTQTGQLLNNILYYWRVSATNGGGTSPWSSVWHFTTVPAPPAAPLLIYPGNGALNISVTTALDWSDVPTATSYEVQISTNASFNGGVVFDDTRYVSNDTVPPGILSGQTLYYWRVKASNAGGDGPWSSVNHFTTALAPPAAPQLLQPPNGSINIILTPTLDWNDVTNNQSYRVQVSPHSNFDTLTINQLTGNVSQFTIPANRLAYSTAYYWRVNATNSGGTGLWSTVWVFTTIPPVPPAPVLISPVNGATGVSLTPIMTWNSSAGAFRYEIQISTSATFGSTVLDDTTSTPSYGVQSGVLYGNTLYYWRVRGWNPGGNGAWSTIWHFTTMQSFNLGLKVYLEGFYNPTTQVHVRDTIKIYLAQQNSPFTLKDSTNAYLGADGTVNISFTKAANGNYWIIIKHRNHLETWSSTVKAFSTGNTVNYDFTTAGTQAYGSNMKHIGNVWVLYAGDANQDGTIDSYDYDLFVPQFGTWGYKSCDFNGDYFVDGYDLYIYRTNFLISKITP